ncbi:MAG: NAD-dependent epimerase/dehydratase family protein, partial [Bacteroidia bacterium]|nr:NAD-dependent epimerase/dehydratase family protein [Bacteroidia bacterium]
MSKERILIIGAGGQIGLELVPVLEQLHGQGSVIPTDLHLLPHPKAKILNALDKNGILSIVESEKITQIYLLAALLSATGEKNPSLAWELNMNSLLYVLDIAKEKKIKVFWPSSIAAFGPHTPR